MNTKALIITAALAATLAGADAYAQSGPGPAPNQIVYVPQLPGPAELTAAAPGQGVTIAQITQTSGEVTVVYKLPNGQSNTVAYRPLSSIDSSASAPATAPSSPAPAATVAGPTSTVVYTQQAVAPYYYYPADYYPWYGPVGIDVGLGWGWGWHGGGGWRDGGGWRGGGHWR